MFTKVTKIIKKKAHRCQKKLQKVFQTSKKDFFDKLRKVFHLFQQDAKNVSLFSTKCEKCLNFFDKLQKMFHFFRQNAKSVLLFSTKCEKCFTFFDKM